jgi:hypothetical protein
MGVLYNGPGDRTFQDVDVLVAERDLEHSLRVLGNAGFMPAVSGSLQDYLAFVRRSPGFAGNEAVALADSVGGTIDLHWRLGRLETEPLLAEAEPVRIFGRPVPLVRPTHCITLAAHHALRNDFVPDEIVRDLIDFRNWLARMQDPAQALAAGDFAEQNRLLGPALALARLVEGYTEHPSPTLAEKPAAEHLRVATDLEELYRIQLEEGCLNTDLVYLASGRSIGQILAGLSSGWGRYRAQMKALEQTNGRLPAPLGGRLRRFAADVWRLPLRRWRLVRTLAAAKSAGAG